MSLCFDYVLSILQRTLCSFKQLHQISTSNVLIASVKRKCKKKSTKQIIDIFYRKYSICHQLLPSCRSHGRVTMGITVANGHKKTVNCQKRIIFTVKRQMSKPISAVKMSQISLIKNLTTDLYGVRLCCL